MFVSSQITKFKKTTGIIITRHELRFKTILQEANTIALRESSSSHWGEGFLVVWLAKRRCGILMLSAASSIKLFSL